MMDFTLDDTQASLASLARQIFDEHATHERLKELEAGGQSFDSELWTALERSGLLTVGVEDGGFVEQCIVLFEQGRSVAPVPLWSHLLGAAVLGPREGVIALALDEPGADDAYAVGTTGRRRDGGWVLTGVKAGVPAVDDASAMVISASTDEGANLFAVDPAEVVAEARVTTAGFTEHDVSLVNTRAELLPANADDLSSRAVVALCALAVGVAERALELTARYTTERKQFGRPLGSFQAVQQRAADAYIDVEAMRTTMWQAAWRLDTGLEARREVAIAKFWASEGGRRVVSSAQHLHGGLGADVDYPLHRYTLWSKWLELGFGSATPQLASLGRGIAG